MKKKIKTLLAGILIGSVIIGGSIGFTEPGSNKDPLVSLSYLNGRIEELKAYVDKKIDGLEIEKSPSEKPSSGGRELEIVQLKAGQLLIGGAGTEIILRSGEAVAIASELGGVSDVTSGVDLTTNQKIERNHQLIIPRDDGRGAYSETNTFFMVRGDYRVE